MTPQRIDLLPPVHMMPLAEPPAYLNNSYHDSPKHANVLARVEDFTEVTAVQAENSMTAEQSRNVEQMVFDNYHIKERNTGKNVFPIGLHISESKKGDAKQYMFVAYDYKKHQTLEIHLKEGLQQVTEVKVVDYQPAPSESEVLQAIEVARNDKNVAGHIDANMVGQAILIGHFDFGAENYRGRLFDVQFGNATERLPYYKAIVDLGLKKVLYHRTISKNN